MKHFFTISILLWFFAVSTSIAQTDWTKYPGSPVLVPGSTNSWEGWTVYAPFVLKQMDTLKLWYTGSKSFDVDHIGYATSIDGIHWQRYNANPVLLAGTPGSWDDEVVSHSKIILIDTTYHMWYGGTGVSPYYNYSAGYATSPDGINWTKYDNPSTTNPPFAHSDPVLTPGPTGSWDSATLAGASFFFDGDSFHVWYGGCDSQNWSNGCIGYAKSADGINWIKYPDNPVFCGSDNSWDSFNSIAPCVIVDSSGYKMWYSGSDGSHTRIGYAISVDGIIWTAMDDYVLDIGNPGNWDDDYVGQPHVIFNDTTYSMWHGGGRVTAGTRIGYATAPVSNHYVPGNYSTIQAAINAATDGDVVLVADGMYQENINFKGKSITVASHFYMDGDTSHISNTIIDGSQSTDPDSGSVVYFVSGEDTNSVLCGFTITGGTGTYELDFLPQNNWRSGGGIYCASGGTIKNNKIVQNTLVLGDTTWGGGIIVVLYNDEYLIIEDNIISSNHSAQFSCWGGGIFSYAIGQSHVRLVNNRISDNVVNALGGVTAGAGFACESNGSSDKFTIIGNTINNNLAITTPTSNGNYGVGLHIWNSPILLANNKIVNNISNTSNSTSGIGMRLILSDDAIIERNIFSGNRAFGNGTSYGGGIYLYDCSARIQNNIIVDNHSSIGGGFRINIFSKKNEELIACNSRGQKNIKHNFSNSKLISEPVLMNNTIFENVATIRGGGISSRYSNPLLVNSISWSDSTSSGAEIDGPATILYSDIKGGHSGTGNIDADPLFFGSIFNLSPNSLCVGTGIDSILGYHAPPFDYDGDPRPNSVDEFVDMGAQESNFPNGIIKEDSDNIPKIFSLKQNYPNPFNPRTTIQFSVPKAEYVTLKIFNLLGQEVTTLVSDKLTPGEYKYTWDASQLASGVYFYKLEAGNPSTGSGSNFMQTKKMILLR